MSVSAFSPEEIEELRQAFNLFDKDGGGTIDVAELRAILDQRGKRMSDKELRQLMDMVDEDRSGEIDFEEVLKFTLSVFSASFSPFLVDWCPRWVQVSSLVREDDDSVQCEDVQGGGAGRCVRSL